MLNYDTSTLEKNCQRIIKILEGQLSWKWDERFGTALAEFSTSDEKSIRTAMKTHLGDVWADDNSETAPESIQTIIHYFGGLNPGQKLFASTPDKNDIILCAWWPWGNGQSISIRLGVFCESFSDEDNEKLTQMFKCWLNL